MYALKPHEGILLLEENGIAKNCPFQQMGIVTSQLGKQQMFHKGCGTWCPLFKLHEISVVEIYCGSKTVSFPIEVNKE
jgi:hypothetical protein